APNGTRGAWGSRTSLSIVAVWRRGMPAFCRGIRSRNRSRPAKSVTYEATTSTWLNSQRSEERTQEDTMNPGERPDRWPAGVAKGQQEARHVAGVLAVDDLQHRRAAVASSKKAPKLVALPVSSFPRWGGAYAYGYNRRDSGEVHRNRHRRRRGLFDRQ